MSSRYLTSIFCREDGRNLWATETHFHEYNLLNSVLIICQIVRLCSHFKWYIFWGQSKLERVFK
jgi:hypothetical protein